MIKLPPTFGHTQLNGMQYKDAVRTNKGKVFIKLDAINPASGKHWLKDWDYQYSSVSESVASCFTRHIQSDYRYADYHFALFKQGSKILTGTWSPSYIKAQEDEYLLSNGSHTFSPLAGEYMTADQYGNMVVDSKPQDRLEVLTRLFEACHVPRDVAIPFLKEQAVVDTLLGNQDRLHNPSNFVFARNGETGESQPVMMDYGRCLPLQPWTATTEANYYLEEWGDEDAPNYVDTLLMQNDGVFSSMGSSVKDVLTALQAKPLVVDMPAVHRDLTRLDQVFQHTPMKTFARMKIKVFQTLLEDPRVKPWVLDSTSPLSLPDKQAPVFTR